MLIGETLEIPFPTGYCSFSRWKGNLVMRMQAELIQATNVKSGLAQAKNKFLVYFA